MWLSNVTLLSVLIIGKFELRRSLKYVFKLFEILRLSGFLPWLEPQIRRVECRCTRCCPSRSPLADTGCCRDSGCRAEPRWTGSGIWDQWRPEIEPWRRWGAWCHPPPWGSRLAHPPPPEQLQPTQSYFWYRSRSLSKSLKKFHSSSTSSTTLSKLCKNWSYFYHIRRKHNIKNIQTSKKDQKEKIGSFSFKHQTD